MRDLLPQSQDAVQDEQRDVVETRIDERIGFAKGDKLLSGATIGVSGCSWCNSR